MLLTRELVPGNGTGLLLDDNIVLIAAQVLALALFLFLQYHSLQRQKRPRRVGKHIKLNYWGKKYLQDNVYKTHVLQSRSRSVIKWYKYVIPDPYTSQMIRTVRIPVQKKRKVKFTTVPMDSPQ